MKFYDKNELKEALNGEKIDLFVKEWEIIINDPELSALLRKRIKEGLIIEELSNILSNLFLTEEYFQYYLYYLKYNEPEELIRLFANYEEMISAIKDELKFSSAGQIVMDFYNENKEWLFDSLSEQYNFESISNLEMIDYIIKNNIINCIPQINITNPSVELEDFIIRNINNIKGELSTYSDRIVEEVVKRDKVECLKKLWSESPEIEELLVDAIRKGKIKIKDMPREFQTKYILDKSIFKASIEDLPVFLFDEIEQVIQDPEIVDFIVESLKNNKDVELLGIFLMNPKLLIAFMKYKNDEAFQHAYIQTEHFENAYREYPEEFESAFVEMIKKDKNGYTFGKVITMSDSEKVERIIELYVDNIKVLPLYAFNMIVKHTISSDSKVVEDSLIKVFQNNMISFDNTDNYGFKELIKYCKLNERTDLLSAIKKCIMDQKNVPLIITSLLDSNIRNNCTYSIEALSQNPMLFTEIIISAQSSLVMYGDSRSEVTDLVLKAKSINAPIDLFILYETLGIQEALQYNNLTFKHPDCARIIYESFGSGDMTLQKKILRLYLNNSSMTTILKTTHILDILYKKDISQEIVDLISNTYIDRLNIEQADLIKSNLPKLLVIKGITSKLLDIIEKKHPDYLDNETLLKVLIACHNTPDEERSKRVIFPKLKIYGFNFDSIPKQIFDLHYPELDEIILPKLMGATRNYKWLDEGVFAQIKNNRKLLKKLLDFFVYRIDDIDISIVTELLTIFPEAIDTVIKEIYDLEINSNYIEVFLLPEVAKRILSSDPSKIHEYINAFQNYEMKKITKETYDILEKYIVKEYNINKDNLNLLINTFGFEVLKKETFNKLMPILREDRKTVERFVEIYKIRELDVVTIQAINDPLQQELYLTKHEYERNLFNNILNRIINGELDDENELYTEIARLCQKDEQGNYLYIPKTLKIDKEALEKQLLDPKVVKNLSEGEKESIKLEIEVAVAVTELYKTDKEEAIKKIFAGIRINSLIYADLLHQITDCFIDSKREEVKRGENIFIDTDVEREVNEHKLPEVAFAYYCVNRREEMIIILDNELNRDGTPLDQYKRETYIKIIDFLGKRVTSLTKEESKQIKNLKKTLLEGYFSTINATDLPEEVRPYYEDRISYLIREIGSQDIDKINIGVVLKIIKDDEIYNCLIKLIKKYKIFEWGKIFKRVIDEMGICEDEPDMYMFINCFLRIFADEKKRLLQKRAEEIDKEITELEKQKNGTNDAEINEKIEKLKKLAASSEIDVDMRALTIIKQAIKYTTNASIYKLLFGKEDYELIRDNPPGNSAFISGLTIHQLAMKRFERNRELLLKALAIEEITIPSFIKDYGEEKPLQVIVGCKADPRNLTMGERTGACMRAYGVGNNLFEFAVADPRGFNITFIDPETGEFVSRITGFRNGNTVFLNQLRNSCKPNKYNNNHLVEVLKEVAKDIIDKGKDKTPPIDNVVADPSYCLAGRSTRNIGVDRDDFAYFNGWLDVNRNAVVLATTGKKVELDQPNQPQPTFKCCRLKPRVFLKEKITETEKILIQRVDAIKSIRENSNDPEYYRTIDFDEKLMNSELVYAIIGQDFYVAIDSNLNLIHNSFGTTEESQKEYEEAIKTAQTHLNSIAVNGGFKNG